MISSCAISSQIKAFRSVFFTYFAQKIAQLHVTFRIMRMCLILPLVVVEMLHGICILRCSTPNAHRRFYIGSAVTLDLHLTLNKRGLANELGNKPAIGSRIDILRRADLQEAALVENCQPIGDR